MRPLDWLSRSYKIRDIASELEQRGFTRVEDIEDPRASPIEEAERKEMAEIIAAAIATLSPRRQKLIYMRFYRGLTLDKCAARESVTRERTRQLIAAALLKLETRLKKTFKENK